MNNCAPNDDSSAEICLLTDAFDKPIAEAAFEKLPISATCRNVFITLNLSMIIVSGYCNRLLLVIMKQLFNFTRYCF